MSEKSLITWNLDSEMEQALSESSDSLEGYDGIQKNFAGHRSFLDIEPNRSVRTGYGRDDYNRFRSSEAVPKKQKQAMKMCMEAYDRVGIIRNVIDLMSDFASKGVMIVHPNKRIEKFYRKWFEKISGKERSERFLNMLYRCGNIVVKRRTAKVTKKLETQLRQAAGEADVIPETLNVQRREIPWKFDFLNPLTIEVLGRELPVFAGNPQFALQVSNLVAGLSKNGGPHFKKILDELPADIAEAIRSGKRVIDLDPDKVSAYYYKKDDWLTWANPMIYAILDDVIMLEKMKLADISALDGAISNIRLWTIGDLDNKILPTKAAINKLRNILSSNVGGGTMDLVWGPEIKFQESNTQVFRFLGKEKYEPVLTSIYAGLGIPPTLTGAGGGNGGFTNNFVSLKTLVERLQYGRDVLLSFWSKEIAVVQKAMGFRLPAQIRFDRMILSDEAAEKNLIIQLMDRDIISAETVRERFGELADIEKIRIRREERERQLESAPQKAGPYHNPQHRNDLEKISLQKDLVSPEDLGIIPSDDTGLHPLTNPKDRRDSKIIEEKKEEEENKRMDREKKKFENRNPNQPGEKDDKFDPKGRPEDGRPKLSKDKQKRKQKTVEPSLKAETGFVNILLWATDAQKKIADIVHPALLAHYGKKNLRGLTKSEMDELEYIKLCILCNLKPYVDIDASLIQDILNNKLDASADVLMSCKSLINQFISANDRQPTIEEVRQIQSASYSMHL